MRSFVFTLIGITLSPTLFAADACDKLAGEVMTVVGLPQKVAAGTMASPIQFTLDETIAERLKGLKSASISVELGNGIPGAKGLTEGLRVKSMKGEINTKFEVTFDVPPTAQGIYKPSFYFTAQDHDGEYCFPKDFKVSTSEGIEVPTHPGADIYAPVVSDTRLDKKSAAPGEEIVLSFSVTDRENSKICTGEADKAKLCSASLHLAFTAPGNETLQTYDPIRHVEGNTYEIRSKVPAATKPGLYALQIVNIEDFAGNRSSAVDEKEKLTTLEIIPR